MDYLPLEKKEYNLNTKLLKGLGMVLISVFCLENGLTQTCGALNFSTQSEVNLFPVNYPDCHAFTALNVTGSDIRNLDSLYPIDSIYGGVWLNNAEKVNDISGLSSLKYIGNNFSITFCDSLVDISMSNLNFIGGTFNLQNNQALTDLQTLSNLIYIGGSFLITGHDNLVSLNGLNDLNFVGDVINISFNSSLTNLMRLRHTDLFSITSLQISNNPNLNNCDISTICDLIDLSISCNINIFSNGAGCNTAGLVAEDCNLNVCGEVLKIGCGGTIWNSPNGWDDRLIPGGCSNVTIPSTQSVLANVDVCIETLDIKLGSNFETTDGKEFFVTGPESCDP